MSETLRNLHRLPMRSFVFFMIKIAMAGIVFSLLFHFVNLDKVLLTLGTANPVMVCLGVLVFLAGQVLAAERWRLILRSGAVIITLRSAWRINQIGTFAGNFLPGMATGDFTKSVFLFRVFPDSRSFLVSSVIYDRIMGLVATLIIAALGAFILGISGGNWSFILPIVAVSSLFLLGLNILFSIGSMEGASRFLPTAFVGRVSVFIGELTQLLRRHILIWPTLRLSLIFQVSWVISMWLMLCAIQPQAPFLSVLIAAPLSLVVALLPVSLNGLGLREGAFSYILQHLGIDAQTAAAASLLGLIPILISSLIGGAALALRRD